MTMSKIPDTSYQNACMLSPTKAKAGSRPSPSALLRVRKTLESELGPNRVLAGTDIPETYASDESGFGAFAPDLLIRPRSAQEISIILREASREGVPVVPRGGGTGRVGGALPVHGGIVLSLEQMNKIHSIDQENFLARVEPGMILENFENAVEEKGLFYPPDPSSLDACSLGGNVACNAGGPRALKYGVTANYVLGLQVVLPTGEIIQTGRRTVKGGAGYELHKLMVGSEGTLGVITEITFRLVTRPTKLETALFTFADTRSALRASVATMSAGVVPRSMEFMDRVAMAAARTKAPQFFPREAGSCLLVELDGQENEDLLEQMARVAEICEEEASEQVLIAQDEAQRRELWSARRDLSPTLRESHPCKVSEDIVVPRAQLADMVQRLEDLGARHGVTIAAFGHAGDGNIHCNVLFDEAHRQGADAACVDILKAAVEVGGTLAGEHGTGLQKIEALRLEQSAELLNFQSRLKRFFDPAGIMNPGKVVSC